MPLTTAALEQVTRPIGAGLSPRRYGLKNRERLNRLLMLHVKGTDNVHAWTKAIRTWLENHGGRPVGRRRAIAGPPRLTLPALIWTHQMRED